MATDFGWTSREDREKALWQRYKQGDQTALSELLISLFPLIERTVQQWSGSSIPVHILRARATNLATEALRDWDPSKAKMNTHIVNRLQKLSRLVYEHQNVARIPESRSSKIGAFQAAEGTLWDDLGREPSVAELSDYLAWNPKEIEKIQKDMRREVPSSYIESPVAFDVESKEKMMLDYFYSGLNQTNQVIFEHITGYGGKPVLTNNQIARRVNVSRSEVENRKTDFVNRLKDWKVML